MKFFSFFLILFFSFSLADCPEDFNNDGVANVVDIVYLVNFVLNEECSPNNDDGNVCNDEDGDEICDDVDECVGQYDSCNICNGNDSCLGMELATANLILENQLVNLYMQDVDHPSEIDFNPAYDAYMYCLSIAPDNPNANFGAALTGFLTISQDPILLDIIEEWENYNGWLIPDDDDNSSSVSSMIGNGIPSGSNFLLPAKINILNYLPINHVLDFGMDNNFNFSFPSLVEYQTLIDDVFIARLSQGIENLEKVVGEDYSFTITPQMQNDDFQTAMEMDDTEFYALKSSMHFLRAILQSINTYSFDGLDPLAQFSHDYSWLESESDFLTIRDGAENYLPRVHDDLNNILISIQNAYSFCEAETDYQGNDIILWQEINTSDFDEAINEAFDKINNNFIAEICNNVSINSNEISGSSEGYCTDVNVDINLFLNSPPYDLKELIPEYHIITIADPYDNFDESGWTYQNISVPSECSEINSQPFCEINHGDGQYCYWQNNNCYGSINTCEETKYDCAIEYYDNQYTYISHECYGSQDLYEFAMETVDSYLSIGDENTNLYLDIDYWDSNCAECEDIQWYYWDNDYSCGDNARVYFEIQNVSTTRPCLIFDAPTYGVWLGEWDIHLNGLFPNIDSYTFFNDLLNVDQQDWSNIQNCE
tara:strand:+ start:2315 stop:4273 length:1959 start_codon:yes stop_codon:yes gene_type:complete